MAILDEQVVSRVDRANFLMLKSRNSFDCFFIIGWLGDGADRGSLKDVSAARSSSHNE